MFKHRVSGGKFQDEDGLRVVATKLGLSKNVVKQVYTKHKHWLLSLSTKRESNHGQGNGEIETLLELAKFNRSRSRDL